MNDHLDWWSSCRGLQGLDTYNYYLGNIINHNIIRHLFNSASRILLGFHPSMACIVVEA
jgi:hypothetical protein